MNNQDDKWKVVKILATDYSDYGGDVTRWQDGDKDYPDCSSNCKHWVPLYNAKHNGADGDWGVCVSEQGPRGGLLTWEHQAGDGCFLNNLSENEK